MMLEWRCRQCGKKIKPSPENTEYCKSCIGESERKIEEKKLKRQREKHKARLRRQSQNRKVAKAKKRKKQRRKKKEAQNSDKPDGMSYSEYIESDHWKERREKYIRTTDRSCEKCGKHLTAKTANVHHIRYRKWGKERDKDLLLLCRSCHAEIHRRQDAVMREAKELDRQYRTAMG